MVGLFALCAALCSLSLAPRTAHAQGKPKPHAAAPRKPIKKSPKKPDPEAETPDPDAASDTAATDDKTSAEKPDKGEPTGVKAAGTNATKAASGAATPVAVKENKEGMKTYKFGTIEVESRLKSPQIIYFLRRVRAEFDAGLLGHRSFMRELSDTRNNPSFR
jgi:hypothetical protein